MTDLFCKVSSSTSLSEYDAEALVSLSRGAVDRLFTIERAVSHASAYTRWLICRLLRPWLSPVTGVDWVMLLTDVGAVRPVKRAVSELVVLASMDDSAFSEAVTAKSHAERKALWDVASIVVDSAPCESFPLDDVDREASMLREALSSGFASGFDGVLDLLALSPVE